MTEINFKSTYRIPVSQKGINANAKAQLKKIIDSYPNHIVGTGNTGFARVSMPNSQDNEFRQLLKKLGYVVYKIFPGENIAKKDLDEYIKGCLAYHDYEDVGKTKTVASVPEKKSFKERHAKKPRYIFGNFNVVPVERQKQLRQTDDYKEAVEKYGVEGAEAIFFYSRKEVYD